MSVLNKRRLFSRLLRQQEGGGEGGSASGNTPPPTPAATTPPAPPAGEGNTPPAGGSAPVWHDSIEDPALKAFIQGKGFKDAGEAAKALQEMEGKAAVPESADAYELPVPEGQDKAFAGEAAKWMHEAGIPVAQAKVLAEKWNAHAAAQQQAADLARQQQGEADLATLRQEWGGQFDANAELGRRAVRTFGVEADAVEKISQALGDAETLRLFARIGKHLGEGTLIPEGGDRGGAATPVDPEAARAARMFPSMQRQS